MTVAVAGGAAKASPPPVPALERPDCVAAKALSSYLCLASMWVGGAGVAAASFIDLASAGGAYVIGFPVFSALLKLSTDTVLFGVLLFFVVILLLQRAALRLVVTDLGVGIGLGINQIPRESMESMLRDTAVIGWLASLPFVLLSFFGCLVLIVQSPAKGSLSGRISTAVIDVGVLGSMVLSCFVTIPSMVLKLWRMSPGVEGHDTAHSIV